MVRDAGFECVLPLLILSLYVGSFTNSITR
jgi:hypothetical protein